MKATITLMTVSLLTSISFASGPMTAGKSYGPQERATRSLEKASDDLAARSHKAESGSRQELSLREKTKEKSDLPEAKRSATEIRSGGQEGNGGAGISRNGSYMTFHSAGVRINSRPKLINEIPGMLELQDFLSTTEALDATLAGQLLAISIPSDTHQYYDVDEKYFTPEVEARLRSEYARISGLPLSEVVLFAITDTATKETYLLPNFYRLKSITEQMAILAHENLWIYRPLAQSKQIVAWEMLFQAHFEDPSNPIKAYALAASFGHKSSFRYAVSSDAKRGILVNANTLQDTGSSMLLTIQNLFGSSYTQCIIEAATTVFWKDCQARSMIRIAQLRKAFPSSLLMRWLAESLASTKIYIHGVSYNGDTDRQNFWWGNLKEFPKAIEELLNTTVAFTEEVVHQHSPTIDTKRVYATKTFPNYTTKFSFGLSIWIGSKSE